MTKTFWDQFNATVPRQVFARNVQNDIAELLNQSKAPLAELGQPITKEDIVAEFNRRNYFSEEVAPIVNMSQAIAGAVSQVLTLAGRVLYRPEREYLGTATWDSWVTTALAQAQSVYGTRHVKGANWWR